MESIRHIFSCPILDAHGPQDLVIHGSDSFFFIFFRTGEGPPHPQVSPFICQLGGSPFFFHDVLRGFNNPHVIIGQRQETPHRWAVGRPLFWIPFPPPPPPRTLL